MRIEPLALAVLLACRAEGATAPVASRDVAPPAADLVIRGARIFDGERLGAAATVYVDDGTIVAITESAEAPAGATVIEADGNTLLPGFIDAHAHVNDPEDLAQAAVFGVTTELDMMTDPGLAAVLRKRRTDGAADLRSAGFPVTGPGGHGTEYGLPVPTVRGVDEVAAFVDARLAEGSDYIKIMYDAGIGPIRFVRIGADVLAAAIAEAHRRHVLAIVHIGSAEEARAALEAGADGLAHLFLDGELDASLVALARDRKAFVTDTLPVLAGICEAGRGGALAEDPALAPYVSPEVARNLRASYAIIEAYHPSCDVAFATARALHEAGVPLLASTDAPNPGTAHGVSIHDALALLVRAGLSPSEALAAATARPAERFGLDDRGRIRVGARADLVLVHGDPTHDITATRSIVEVWVRGQRVDRRGWREQVARARAADDALRRAPAPAGSADGLVSDFEDGTPRTRYGLGWTASTDALIGGDSKVELGVVRRGAGAGKHALRVRGELTATMGDRAWAGAMFMPGAEAMAPANLGGKTSISFLARGTPGTYAIMMFSSPVPEVATFEVRKAWSRIEIPLARFPELQLYALRGVFLGASGSARTFELVLDDVRID